MPTTPVVRPTLVPPLPSSPAVFLLVAEVAELLRVDVQTVRGWVGRGELPAYRVARGLRVRTDDLDAFLTAQRVRP